ncbi:hypothetical protein PIIN_04638 [Serendipita indica DSM 11827]|uniref:Uncharacterized protein n=1 Tax=Serendipita indica (strain DSM 11827) TaxID=1109443 RepID=G4THB1_SERID|nr:hypothetical protein PIIN_04638 [Serendipita indica DSM 11827]
MAAQALVGIAWPIVRPSSSRIVTPTDALVFISVSVIITRDITEASRTARGRTGRCSSWTTMSRSVPASWEPVLSRNARSELSKQFPSDGTEVTASSYALVRSCASVSNWVATWPSSVLFDSPFPRYISAWSITFRKNCSCATSSEDGPRARH